MEAEAIARHADSVTFCLSKGLGAPVGSALCGTRDFIGRARRTRRMVGGTMRQAGVLAAAGLHALEHMAERLAEDHAHARRLAAALAEWGYCDPAQVETNIVFADVSASGVGASEWAKQLGEHGIVCRANSATRMRLVLHADVSGQDVDAALSAFAAVRRSL